jgi:hypothetical protein
MIEASRERGIRSTGGGGKSDAVQARVEKFLIMHAVLEAGGGAEDIGFEERDLDNHVRDD